MPGLNATLRVENLETREVPAVFTVNGVVDGITPDGELTLREAMSLNTGGLAFGALSVFEKAQVSGTLGTNDTIQFATSGTILLSGDLPTLTKKLTVTGPGADKLTIDGDLKYRPLTVGAAGDVTVTGLRLSRGFSATSGGAALNNGKLTASQVEFVSNKAGDHGGAIENNGTLIVDQSYLFNNTSVKVGGAIDNNATATVTSSTFYNNFAGNNGGAVWSNDTLTLVNDTFYQNRANNFGGAVRLTGGTTTIASSTVILNYSNYDAVGSESGGGVSNDGSTVTLNNTVVADNIRYGATPVADDVTGAASGLFNFIGVNTGLSGISNGTNNNRVGTTAAPLDPNLGFLVVNGGFTTTMMPNPGSPLIGTGAPLALAGVTDQRGVARTAGKTTVGAVEVAVNTPPTISDVADLTNPTGLDILFTVGDAETPVYNLNVTAVSSNLALFPAGSVEFDGTGANRSVILTPAAGQFGTAVITLTVTDGHGDTATDTFTVVVDPPSVNPHADLYAVGADAGGGPHVKVYNADGSLRFSFYAYAPAFTGGVRVATGDVTGDGIDDIVTAAGAGGGPHVKVFDGATGQELRSFFAYDPSFTGGVTVAVGDLNGDGHAEVITGAGAGGGPHVKAFDGNTGAEVRSFLAFGAGFTGGVNVASGDLNGDGRDDIVVGAGAGSSHVRAFDGVSGAEAASFFAYGAGFSGGVSVAAGDLDGDGKAEIVTGAGAGGGPHVKAFGSDGGERASFFAYDPAFAGGVRVGVTDTDGNGKAEILTAGGTGVAGPGKRFSVAGDPLAAFDAFPGFTGGVLVG